MARTRMVTRTINVTTITAICMDLTTPTNPITETRTLDITGEKYDSDKALKVAKKQYETDTFKVVAIATLDYHEEMYGLLEIDFIKYAQKLDPTTRKMLETETEE